MAITKIQSNAFPATIDLSGVDLTIGTGEIATTNLADSAVSTAKLASAVITPDKLADSAVHTSKLASSSITTPKIADNAIHTAKIAATAVTHDKLHTDMNLTSKTVVLPDMPAFNFTSGNVGIGTDSANTPLEVVGTVTATSYIGDGSSLTGINTDLVSDTTPQLGGNLDLNSSNITGTGNVNITGTVTATSFSGDGSSLTGIESLPDAISVNGSASANTINIDASSNVGIGTASPATTLHVHGSIYSSEKLQVTPSEVNYNGGSTKFASGAAVEIYPADANTSSLVIGNSGGKAHTWFNYADGNNYITGDTTNNEGATIIRSYSEPGGVATYTERMRVHSNGTVRIGASSNHASEPQLYVYQDNRAAEPYCGIYVKNPDTSGAAYTGLAIDANSQSHLRFLQNGSLKWQLRYGVSTTSGELRAYSWTAGTDVFSISESNYAYTAGSLRAPIFYDTDNTGYYLNPAAGNTSNSFHTNGIISRVGFNTGSNGNDNCVINAQDYSHWIWRTASNWGIFWAGNDNAAYTYWGTTNPNEYVWVGSGSVRGSLDLDNGNFYAAGQVRSQIFYDSNDTAYYLDPSSSNSAKLRQYVNIGDSSSYSSNSGNWGARLNVVDDVHARIDVGQDANSMLSTWYAHTGHSGPLFGTSTAHPLRMMYNGSEVGYWNSDFLYHNSDIRSPIFYDSNNTNYYIHGDGESSINSLKTAGTVLIGGSYGNNHYNSVSSTRLTFGGGNDINNYFIGTNMENYGGNYTKLDLRWHTGIRMGAQQGYGGVRIFDSEDLGTVRFSVAKGDANTRVESGSFYSNIMYDRDNTSYYVDPHSYSSLYGVAIRGDVSSTAIGNQIFFWSTGGTTTSAIGFKSNGGNFTNPTGNGDGYNTYLSMDTVGRGWVFRRATGGSDFSAAYTSGWILNNGIWQANASMRSPIFYDSNNTAYYFDGHSTGDSIRVAGDIVAYYSDARLKDFHGRINNALDKVLKINGYYYTENETAKSLGYNTGRTQVGVSAQEVEEVLPEVIKDAPIGHGYKTVQYERMIPLLLEAIKELKEENDELKARLDAAGI